MKNKEIELKFMITKEQKELILNELESEAEFEGEKRQIDTYYIPKFKSIEENGETKECLRIRESGEKIIMCYKNMSLRLSQDKKWKKSCLLLVLKFK